MICHLGPTEQNLKIYRQENLSYPTLYHWSSTKNIKTLNIKLFIYLDDWKIAQKTPTSPWKQEESLLTYSITWKVKQKYVKVINIIM